MEYQQFIAWLGATALSEWLKEVTWIVPAVQSVHILGIGVVLSCSVIIALRLIGVNARHLHIFTLNERLIPATWWALLLLAITGAALIVAEPTRTLNNPYFFAKMGCLIALIPLARWFQLNVRKRPNYWATEGAPSPAVLPAVGLGMVLLVAVIFCGRWIAYA